MIGIFIRSFTCLLHATIRMAIVFVAIILFSFACIWNAFQFSFYLLYFWLCSSVFNAISQNLFRLNFTSVILRKRNISPSLLIYGTTFFVWLTYKTYKRMLRSLKQYLQTQSKRKPSSEFSAHNKREKNKKRMKFVAENLNFLFNLKQGIAFIRIQNCFFLFSVENRINWSQSFSALISLLSFSHLIFLDAYKPRSTNTLIAYD